MPATTTQHTDYLPVFDEAAAKGWLPESPGFMDDADDQVDLIESLVREAIDLGVLVRPSGAILRLHVEHEDKITWLRWLAYTDGGQMLADGAATLLQLLGGDENHEPVDSPSNYGPEHWRTENTEALAILRRVVSLITADMDRLAARFAAYRADPHAI